MLRHQRGEALLSVALLRATTNRESRMAHGGHDSRGPFARRSSFVVGIPVEGNGKGLRCERGYAWLCY